MVLTICLFAVIILDFRIIEHSPQPLSHIVDALFSIYLVIVTVKFIDTSNI